MAKFVESRPTRDAVLDHNMQFMQAIRRNASTRTGARLDLSAANSLESRIVRAPPNLTLNLVSGRDVARHVRKTSSEATLSSERKLLPLKTELKIPPRVDAMRNTLPR